MRAREFVREDVDGQQVLDYIHGTHHEPLTTQLQQAVLSHPRWELRSVPLNSLHIPDQEYDDEEQEPEADPYNRVQAIDPDHAGEYSANFVDRRPIVVDAEGWIIDGNHRAWAAAELLNRDSIQAWVPASQLNELGNAPAEYKPNRKRSRSLFHATVDGQWVDVFFDRSEFNDTLHITFAVNNNYDTPSQPTGASRSTVKILSTVLNIVKQKLPEYMAKARPPAVSFTAKGDNRASLYRKYFVPVIQNVLGPKWQHEEYPSMGMTVFHWRPAKKQGVTEAFDQPYNIRWSKGDHGDYDAYAELDDGTGLEIAFLDQQHNSWMVDFFRDNSTEITGDGDAYRVLATVLTAMREFIVKQQPAKLNFSAEKNDDPTGSRASLYDRMIQRYITGTGYNLTRQNYPDGATYTLTKQAQGVTEGKIKLYTDPGYFGAEVDDAGFDSLPVVNISADRLVGFEPDSKMQQPKSQANVEKIVAGLKKGDKLPPLLVRKYKNGYQVLDGHHRFWAYKLSGTKSIPVRIVADKDIEEISKQDVAKRSQQ